MEIIGQLLARVPGRFSAELGLDLWAGPEDRGKWFLAATLYGARISGTLAARTYRVFAARGVFSPQAILDRGWDGLVMLLDLGGYTRYDFKTATKLLQVMAALKERYDGSLEKLHQIAEDYDDLEGRIRDLGSGIGPVSANIFLRELRGVWTKADPPTGEMAQLAGEHLKLLRPGLTPREALAALKEHWRRQPAPGHEFTDLEATLVRLGRDFCRKPRARGCPMGTYCGRSCSNTEDNAKI